MQKTIYRQYDKRWKDLPYPGNGYKLNGSGCGCLAVTHCVIEIPKYRKYTPRDVQPYMRKWATCGDGTKRDGITDGLKHYGFKDVVRLRDKPMTVLWNEMKKKGTRVGVLLFGGKKGPDGTEWTIPNSAHYIAFTNYKIENGKHYLYLKDSGWRKHDKWRCYEKSMRGDVIDVWVALVPGTDTATPVKTTTPSKAMKISNRALSLCYPAGTPAKTYTRPGGVPCKAFKTAWKKNFPNRTMTTGCHAFVMLVLKMEGYGTMPLSDGWPAHLKWLQNHGFRKIKPKKQNGKIRRDQFKAGDIVYWAKSDGSHHIYIIVKDDNKRRRAEAVQHGRSDHKGDKWSHIGRGLNTDVHKVDYIFRVK